MIKITALIALIVGFLLVSSMDYDNAVKLNEYNCRMVDEGHWPAGDWCER